MDSLLIKVCLCAILNLGIDSKKYCFNSQTYRKSIQSFSVTFVEVLSREYKFNFKLCFKFIFQSCLWHLHADLQLQYRANGENEFIESHEIQNLIELRRPLCNN